MMARFSSCVKDGFIVAKNYMGYSPGTTVSASVVICCASSGVRPSVAATTMSPEVVSPAHTGILKTDKVMTKIRLDIRLLRMVSPMVYLLYKIILGMARGNLHTL
jgi:hypothetical protein